MVWQRAQARAAISAPPNRGPRPLFRGAPGAPASVLLRGPQFRSGSACGRGPLTRAPRIAVQGRFFGGPSQRAAPRPSISEHPTAKASRAQPSARRPPAARGGSVITEPRGARRPPARTHAVGPGTGKSGGGPYALATPPRSRSRAPSKPQGIHPASVGAHVCYSHCALPTGRGPYRTTRSAPTPGSPHIVCSGTTRACKNRGPPPLPFWEGRRRIGRGGETPPPLPFSKALCGVPRPAPRVALAGGRAPSAAVADGRGTVEDGRGGGIRPNGGFQSRL